MKALTITTLLATIVLPGSAQAQFGGRQHGFVQQSHGQHQFGGHQQFRRRGRITPELIQGIIGLFDDRPVTSRNSPLVLTGTWNETLHGIPLQHTMFANGFHQIHNRATGQVNGHQAQFDGHNLQLLNGRYTVTQVSPGVLRLRNFRETRTWTQGNAVQFGGFTGGGAGGGGVIQPPVQQNGVPRQLQGTWFDISPEGNLWQYVISAHSYNMFEIDPRTNQQVFDGGQPIQVINGQLTFAGGVLHLSQGTDVEEGPFNTQVAADGSQLVLTSFNGDQPRVLTRERRI